MVAPPADVLAHYPTAVATLRWVPLGTAGGYSGAAVWRGESPTGVPLFALKAWPPGVTPARLHEVHAAMARAALPFAPTVVPPIAEVGGRVWDVTSWMPGTADFATNPTRLAAAMAALAAIHRAWAATTLRIDVCPGVVRRLTACDRALVTLGPPALTLVAARAAATLRPWLHRPMPLQLCLRDVHADHVLYTHDRVTGVIDYGAVAVDHPAVDLARLIGPDPDRIRPAVELYRASGGVPSVDADFVLALADGGLVGSVLRWLDHPTITPLARSRFRDLVARLEARAGGRC